MSRQSFPARLAELARRHPDKPAVILAKVDGTSDALTYAELLERANAYAPRLLDAGAGPGRFVVVALPNCLEHYVATYACWMTGACVLPLNPGLSTAEREAILELAGDAVVVGEWPGAVPPPSATDASGPALPDVVSHPGKAISSGGSTGRPKIIVDPVPWAREPDSAEGRLALAALRLEQVQLIPGALFHNTPFGWSHHGLFEDHTLVVMEKFDGARALELIERHRIGFIAIVPTMMARMVRSERWEASDLSSLDGIMHTASACPPWVKRAWIDKLGGKRVLEAYGASDYIGSCQILGDEWLEHPGSVGRPADCELRILGPDGTELPSGEVGEIYMKLLTDVPAFEYVGATASTTPDGFSSVGDLGWVDEDGYLFLADRRVDMIVTGGANVYPAEVEAALTEHEQVADCAVIGLSDDEWGRRVHAVIQPVDHAAAPTVEELAEHCRQRLVAYKRPKSFELVEQLPRNEAGKIRRSELITQRESAGA